MLKSWKRPIRGKENTIESPTTSRLPLEVRRNGWDEGVVGSGFAPDLLRGWCEFYEPITERGKAQWSRTHEKSIGSLVGGLAQTFKPSVAKTLDQC